MKLNFLKNRTIKARTLNNCMIITCLLIFGGLIAVLVNSAVKLNSFRKTLEDYSSFKMNSLRMRDISNYLSDQARLFIITGDVQYAETYFNEKNSKHDRKDAMQKILELYKDNDIETKKSAAAFSQMENLSAIEVYAMKMRFESLIDYDGQIPEEFKSIKLKPEEEKLSPAEKDAKATDMLFSSSYLIYKMKVDSSFNFRIDELEKSNLKDILENFSSVSKRIQYLGAALIAIIIILALFFKIYTVEILRPIESYMNSIVSNERLTAKGTEELRTLAETYNIFYDIKEANEQRLRQTAETDPLTGLSNRRAFENICSDFAHDDAHIALLMIDVDNFKGVNDTYGHKVGDIVLKNVASQLVKAFRQTDRAARLGGDEFSVLLTNVNGDIDQILQRKITRINENLAELEGQGYGKVSISVGGVMSYDGFRQELFEKADKALYETKSRGKKGFTLFKE